MFGVLESTLGTTVYRPKVLDYSLVYFSGRGMFETMNLWWTALKAKASLV